ncbi:formate/nitrite transporter family protein [[Eubacterium] cellulosolvens]
MKKPKEIAEAICEVGIRKTSISIERLFLLSILAGAYIGFGSQLMTTVIQDSEFYIGKGFTQFLGGSVFSVGLILVVIGGAELFTGNNLMVIACARNRISILKLLKNWTVVYLGNLGGSLLLAFIVFYAALYTMGGDALGIKAISIANTKANLSFIEALCRGIGCNWLVCLAVWLAESADNIIGKIFAVFFPIMAFVAIGFEHSVANMYMIPMGIFLKDFTSLSNSGLELTNLTWTGFTNNLIPVTIGNIIGGTLFVGLMYTYIYGANSK